MHLIQLVEVQSLLLKKKFAWRVPSRHRLTARGYFLSACLSLRSRSCIRRLISCSARLCAARILARICTMLCRYIVNPSFGGKSIDRCANTVCQCHKERLSAVRCRDILIILLKVESSAYSYFFIVYERKFLSSLLSHKDN